MIKFSIITITYNAEAVLERTLESVAAQTYPEIEHIIVDGASKDSTLTIAEEYRRQSDAAHNGHHVLIKSEPDKGIYDAMNKGLDYAMGTYIVFMNAGDTFASPSTITDIVEKTSLNVIEKEGRPLPAVLYGDTDIYDADGNYLCHRHLSAPERLSWRSFRNGMLVCHQAFYARTDIAKSFKYSLKYRYSADVDWCIRVMKEGERQQLLLRNVHAVIANYVQEGQTTLHHKESLRERFDVMRRHYGLVQTLLLHVWFAIRSVIK